jgi:hypothetical protein
VGVHTISPLTPLPFLTDNGGATIDGYTQPGSSPNTLSDGDNAVLKVELSGASMTAFGNGIMVRSSSNRVRGFAINGFGRGTGGQGIVIQSGIDNVISGCFVGTDASGLTSRPNAVGISVDGSIGTAPRATIGGRSPQDRNVVSGNVSDGVSLFVRLALLATSSVSTRPVGWLTNNNGIITVL